MKRLANFVGVRALVALLPVWYLGKELARVKLAA
jgi:hypothetical protein